MKELLQQRQTEIAAQQPDPILDYRCFLKLV